MRITTDLGDLADLGRREGGRSHAVRSAHAQQVQTIGQHLADGVVEPQAGHVSRVDRIITPGGDTSGAVPGVVSRRELLEVTGHAVLLAELSRLGNGGREAGQGAQQRGVGRVVQGAGIEGGLLGVPATLQVRAWAYWT